MSHDNNKFNGSDSIFNDSSVFPQGFTNPVPQPASAQPVNSEGGGNFFVNLINKFVGNIPKKEEDIELQKQLVKFAKDNEDILEVFNKFDCKMEYGKDGIKLICPQLKIEGKITVKEDKTAEFDDNASRIMNHLANLVSGTNGLNMIVNEYEKQGFYPIDDLVKETVIYQGNSVEVMTGTLKNKQGETKKIYYYKGAEITPDE